MMHQCAPNRGLLLTAGAIVAGAFATIVVTAGVLLIPIVAGFTVGWAVYTGWDVVEDLFVTIGQSGTVTKKEVERQEPAQRAALMDRQDTEHFYTVINAEYEVIR